MKQFSTVEEAFQWWLTSIYPNLTPDEKKGRYRNAWRDYTFKKGISIKRMEEILSDFGVVEVKTLVTFKPK